MKKISDVTPSHLATIKARQKDSTNAYRTFWLNVNFAIGREGHLRNIGANAFVIYIILRTYANKDRVCYPGLKAVGYPCKFSINTTRKAIGILEREGWIKTIGQEKSRTGKFSTNKYELLEKDLIRGSSEPSFTIKPLSKSDNGDSSLTHIKKP